MDMAAARRDFGRWIEQVLDVPHAALNGNSPCPFARQAWTDGRYRLDEATELEADLTGTPDRWEDGIDLWIYVFDPARLVDTAWLAETTNRANASLMPRGYLALEGHPGIPERVVDCDMNQGTYAYAIVQPLEKLRRGRAALLGKGYYDNWPADMLAQIVGIRENPDG